MCRRRHYSPRTAEAYRYWARRYILFHRKQHPRDLDRRAVEQFMNALAARELSASSHSQALNALVFLYREVLQTPFEWLDTLDRPKRPQTLPAVLTTEQVRQVLNRMQEREQLMAKLVYGTGMRILECMTLRVKDLQFANHSIWIHAGKGGKDRLVPMPKQLHAALRGHVLALAHRHRTECLAGRGYAPLPNALAAKYPRATQSLQWQ